MTRPQPVPPALQDTVFTTQDAASHRMNRNRLKAADIVAVARGVYRSADTLDELATPETSVDPHAPAPTTAPHLALAGGFDLTPLPVHRRFFGA